MADFFPSLDSIISSIDQAVNSGALSMQPGVSSINYDPSQAGIGTDKQIIDSATLMGTELMVPGTLLGSYTIIAAGGLDAIIGALPHTTAIKQLSPNDPQPVTVPAPVAQTGSLIKGDMAYDPASKMLSDITTGQKWEVLSIGQGEITVDLVGGPHVTDVWKLGSEMQWVNDAVMLVGANSMQQAQPVQVYKTNAAPAAPVASPAYSPGQTVSFTGPDAAAQMAAYNAGREADLNALIDAGKNEATEAIPVVWGDKMDWFSNKYTIGTGLPDQKAAELAAGIPLYGLASNPEEARNLSLEMQKDYATSNALSSLIGTLGASLSGISKDAAQNILLNQGYTQTEIQTMVQTQTKVQTYAEALQAFYRGQGPYPNQADYVR